MIPLTTWHTKPTNAVPSNNHFALGRGSNPSECDCNRPCFYFLQGETFCCLRGLLKASKQPACLANVLSGKVSCHSFFMLAAARLRYPQEDLLLHLMLHYAWKWFPLHYHHHSGWEKWKGENKWGFPSWLWLIGVLDKLCDSALALFMTILCTVLPCTLHRVPLCAFQLPVDDNLYCSVLFC